MQKMPLISPRRQSGPIYILQSFLLQWLLQNAGKKDGSKGAGPSPGAMWAAAALVGPVGRCFEKLTRRETDTAEKEPIIRAATEEGYVNAKSWKKWKKKPLRQRGRGLRN